MLEDQSYESKFSITLQEAQYRAEIVEKVWYDVSLALPKGEVYCGNINIGFTLRELPKQSLNLDFRGQKICNMVINGKPVQNLNGNSQRLFFNHKI